jgi:thermostable 8-oxoguanine DNA glycosylase
MLRGIDASLPLLAKRPCRLAIFEHLTPGVDRLCGLSSSIRIAFASKKSPRRRLFFLYSTGTSPIAPELVLYHSALHEFAFTTSAYIYRASLVPMQTMYAHIAGEVRELTLPPVHEEVLPGLPWGAFDELMTPAYWRGQAWQHTESGTFCDFRLGRTLQEEVAACLLGGWGMPAELALAAYSRVREKDMLRAGTTAQQLEDVLNEPFTFHGRARKYRFIRQKAKYLSGCLQRLHSFTPSEDDIVFRDQLNELPGIGLKTASWIVRNLRPQSEVAILDIHILRVGHHLGLFPEGWQPETRYRELEARFIAFARAIGVSAATLDGLMWDHMRQLSAILRKAQGQAAEQLDLFGNTH